MTLNYTLTDVKLTIVVFTLQGWFKNKRSSRSVNKDKTKERLREACDTFTMPGPKAIAHPHEIDDALDTSGCRLTATAYHQEIDDAIAEYSFCRVVPVDSDDDTTPTTNDAIDDDIAEFSHVITDVDSVYLNRCFTYHVTKRLEAVYELEQVPDPELMSLLEQDLDIHVDDLRQWFSVYHSTSSSTSSVDANCSTHSFRPWL